MYSPNLGVWMQRDPAEEGLDLYEYTSGNPVNKRDPLGLHDDMGGPPWGGNGGGPGMSVPVGPGWVPSPPPLPTWPMVVPPTAPGPASQPTTAAPTSQPTTAPDVSSAEQTRIKALFSQMQPLAKQLLQKARKDLEPDCVKIKLSETLRTAQRQNEISGQNTQVKGLDSMHCWGLAFDIQLFDKDGKYMTLKGKNAAKEKVFYERVGKIGRELGLIWGGNWKTPYDPSHFQFDIDNRLGIKGPSAAAIRRLYESKPEYTKMTTVQFVEFLWCQRVRPTTQPTQPST